MRKYCKYCESDLPEKNFHWRSKSKGIRIARCRSCWSKYSKNHYNKNKEMYIEKARKWNDKQADITCEKIKQYFNTHPCVDCGEADPVVLTFDHVRGSKSFNISNSMNGRIAWEEVEKEISKCDVRCSNCHLRQTAKRAGWRRYRFAGVA